MLESAVAMEQRAGRADQGTFVELLNVLARTYRDAARYRDAVQTARRAAALVAQLGLDHTTHESTARVLQALALRDGGRPLDALALQTPSAGAAPRVSERIQHASTLLELGRLDGLLPLLEQLLAASRPLGAGAEREVRLLQVQTLGELGRSREAGAALADAEVLFAPLRAAKRYAAHRWLLVRAQWALSVGDRARAQEAIDEAGTLVAAAGQAMTPRGTGSINCRRACTWRTVARRTR